MDSSQRNQFDVLCTISCLLLGLSLRLFSVWSYADRLTEDRDAYLGIAKMVRDGKGYCSPGNGRPTAYRPPLYPLQVALVSSIVPVTTAVASINIIWGMIAIGGTICVGRLLKLGIWSYVAGTLVAIDPMLLVYTAQPMTEVTCAGLVIVLVYSTLTLRLSDPKSAVIAGIVFGFLVLCRPTFWPLSCYLIADPIIRQYFHRSGRATTHVPPDQVAVGTTFSAVSESQDTSDKTNARLNGPPWKQTLWIIAGISLVVLPWIVRNLIVMGSPIMTTTHGGYTVLLSNNPVFYERVVQGKWGTVWDGQSFQRWEEEVQQKLATEVGPSASELECDRWHGRMAREFIASNPMPFLQSVWHRIRSLWNPSPQGDATAGVNSTFLFVVRWYYLAVLTLFILGAAIIAAQRQSCWRLLFALIITVQSVHTVYWTNARMRAPLVPVISLFASAAMTKLSSRHDSRVPSNPEEN